MSKAHEFITKCNEAKNTELKFTDETKWREQAIKFGYTESPERSKVGNISFRHTASDSLAGVWNVKHKEGYLLDPSDPYFKD